MNNEEAIDILKFLIDRFMNIKELKHDAEAMQTVLNYIEKLENRLKEKENIVKKSSLEAQKYFDMLMEVEYGRDTIPKQKIRKKIEELEREFDFYAGREHSEWEDGEFDGEVCCDISLKIEALKELLEEEKI